MNDKIIQILDESIKLELNIADLYMIFYEKVQEDSNFWWQLLIEEKNHAAIIKTGKEFYETKEDFPQEFIASTLNSLIKSNKEVSELINKYRDMNTIDREEALKTAYQLENSAGEIHYQKSMEKKGSSTLLKIFQELNNEDKNHAKRIMKYAEIKNLEI